MSVSEKDVPRLMTACSCEKPAYTPVVFETAGHNDKDKQLSLSYTLKKDIRASNVLQPFRIIHSLSPINVI